GDNPVVRLNRAVAVGEADGPMAGLAALGSVDPALPRRTAAEAYLRERAGEPAEAARLYEEAAQRADNEAERAHLIRSAARLHSRSANCLSGARRHVTAHWTDESTGPSAETADHPDHAGDGA